MVGARMADCMEKVRKTCEAGEDVIGKNGQMIVIQQSECEKVVQK